MSARSDQLRKHWLSVLAKAPDALLEDAVAALAVPDDHQWLRRAETGAAMVRGRMGGSGAPFNMGEMTVTRAAVRFPDGTVGMGYCAGRALRKAELIALLDAFLQGSPDRAEEVLEPIEALLAARRDAAARKAAATKVEFFTMVRGENPK